MLGHPTAFTAAQAFLVKLDRKSKVVQHQARTKEELRAKEELKEELATKKGEFGEVELTLVSMKIEEIAKRDQEQATAKGELGEVEQALSTKNKELLTTQATCSKEIADAYDQTCACKELLTKFQQEKLTFEEEIATIAQKKQDLSTELDTLTRVKFQLGAELKKERPTITQTERHNKMECPKELDVWYHEPAGFEIVVDGVKWKKSATGKFWPRFSNRGGSAQQKRFAERKRT